VLDVTIRSACPENSFLQADNIEKTLAAGMLAWDVIDGWKNRGLDASRVPPGEAAVFGKEGRQALRASIKANG